MFTVEHEGAVATLRHRHPPHDLLTSAALVELGRALGRLERDDTVRVIVLRGAIAHTELDEIERMLADAARTPRFALPFVRLFAGLLRRWPALLALVPARLAILHVLVGFDALERSSKITVAALDELWIGGGLELALCCDYRLCADGARLGCPEVRMGLLPGFGGSQRLARLIGPARARELLLDGTLVDAERAERLGLVSRRIASDRFDEEVRQFAGSLARRPPLAVRAIKRALPREVWGDLFVELRESLRLARTRDVATGLAAYRAALSESSDPIALARAMERVSYRGQ